MKTEQFTLLAMVSGSSGPRGVELRLLNGQGWQPVGDVSIPVHQPIPEAGEVVAVRSRLVHRESRQLQQPVYLGRRRKVEAHECVMSQLRYQPAEAAPQTVCDRPV